MYSLFLDDDKETRFPPRGPAPKGRWVIARSLEEAREIFEIKGMPGFISFDHDLGPRPDDKGIYLAHWLIEIDMDERAKDSPEPKRLFGEEFGFRVHSQNPVGAENIQHLMDNYLRFIEKDQD